MRGRQGWLPGKLEGGLGAQKGLQGTGRDAPQKIRTSGKRSASIVVKNKNTLFPQRTFQQIFPQKGKMQICGESKYIAYEIAGTRSTLPSFYTRAQGLQRIVGHACYTRHKRSRSMPLNRITTRVAHLVVTQLRALLNSRAGGRGKILPAPPLESAVAARKSKCKILHRAMQRGPSRKSSERGIRGTDGARSRHAACLWPR